MLSPDDIVFAEKLQDIQTACRILEDIGYDSLVVITLEHRHIEIGSAKGRQFYEENYDLIEKFVEYCEDDDKVPHMEQDQEMPDAGEINQDSPRVKVVPLEQHVVSATDGLIPTGVFPEDTCNLSSHGPDPHAVLTSEIHADPENLDGSKRSTDTVDDRSVLLKEYENDAKLLKSVTKSDNYSGGNVDKRIDDNSVDTYDDSDDADSDLSALDEDSDLNWEYDTDTNLITTGNGVKTEQLQDISTKFGDEESHISFWLQSRGPFKSKKKKRFACGKCGKTYARREDLICHERIHTGETPYACDKCEKSFRSKKLLRKHETAHSDTSIDKTKTHVCDICNAKFLRQSDLVIHKRKHSGEAPFECDHCRKKFRSRGLMRNHWRTHSNKDSFACDQCDKKYARKEDLMVHKRKHSGQTPFPCAQCPKAFRSRGMLRAHMETHSEERFECDHCELSYATRANLARHKIIHSIDVPYVCHLCGQGFKDPSAFKIHKLGHTGEKPHKCETCGKGFLKSTSLNTHRRIHTGEKPYFCQFCDEKFRTMQYLKKHQLQKHVNQQD